MAKKFWFLMVTILLTTAAMNTTFGQNVPATPSQRYDRFGTYLWTTTYQGGNRLSYLANLAAMSGSRTIRVYLGDFGYGNFVNGAPPLDIASRSEFTTLFNDSRFTTYLITHYDDNTSWGKYTAVGGGSSRRYPDPPANYDIQKQGMKDLANYLTGINPSTGTYRFPGKKFIILNYEADSMLAPWVDDGLYGGLSDLFLPDDCSPSSPWRLTSSSCVLGSPSDPESVKASNPVYDVFWKEFVKWVNKRSDGVREARAAQSCSYSDPNCPQIYYGLEVSKMNRLNRDGTFRSVCGNQNLLQNRCSLDYVAPQVTVDYYAYSSYDTFNSAYNIGTDQAPIKDIWAQNNLKSRLRNDLTTLFSWINRQPSPGDIRGRTDSNTYAEKHIILGELGYVRTGTNAVGETGTGRFMKEAMAAIETTGISYVVQFQSDDSPGVDGTYGQFTTENGTQIRNFLGESFNRAQTAETVWVDDNIPSGSWQVFPSPGVEAWTQLDANATPRPTPMPLSGQYAYQTKTASNDHGLYFTSGAGSLTVNSGDTLFAYVYLDKDNPPQEIMLQWYENGSWAHRAYWGPDMIGSGGGWGTNGQPSHRQIGENTPPTGKWVRLEVPATTVDLAGKTVTGFSIALWGGRAAFDRVGKLTNDTVWVDDNVPSGSRQVYPTGVPGEAWNELNGNATPLPTPLPLSGQYAYRTNVLNNDHTIFFTSGVSNFAVNSGDSLFAYVYLDPVSTPQEVMLQWYDGTWEHRAYWGANNLGWGTDSTSSRQYMGPLPPTGQWVRLEVPASFVSLGGKTITGFSLALWNGRATFDRVGKSTNDVIWFDDDIPTGSRNFDDDTWQELTSSSSIVPASGSKAFKKTNASIGFHSLWFNSGVPGMQLNEGDILFAYVYLDSTQDPQEILLEFFDGTNWDHRAYWGPNLLNVAQNGTDALRQMSETVAVDRWVRLEVPANRIGLVGKTITGFAFTTQKGIAAFDRVGKVRAEHLDY